MENSNESQKIVIVSSSEKSMVAAILLSLIFGPLGLLYASVTGGIVMLLVSIVVGLFTLGFGLLVTFPICIIWAVVATNKYNENVRKKI
jgi:hypothetical protein